MALEGARVVRGRNWKWNDQDGGEGGVGTIINSDASSKKVTVLWDNGNQAQYRAGYNGSFDLRILDSAPAGVKYMSFSCDGCMAGITGMRWNCIENQCKSYNLCTTCYFNDVHTKDHTFTRFDNPNDSCTGVKVGKRSDVKDKITARGLFPGAIVRIGKDWIDGKVHIDKHTQGIVLGVSPWLDTPRSGVIVEWGTTSNIQSCHRTGFQGKVDLKCNDYGEGYLYYEEHLPGVSVETVGRGRLREGDRVTIHLRVDILMAMEKGHGGWIPAMKETIGKVGTVVETNQQGNIVVKYEGLKHAAYTFHPATLYKIPELKEKNKVLLLNDIEIVKKLQNSFWENDMVEVLGCTGEVIGMTERGSAIVAINRRIWEFDPAVLILEHAHHENQEDNHQERVSNMLDQVEENIQSGNLDDIGDELVSAAFEGDKAEVERLVQKDRTKVNYQLPSGKCALHMACLHGRVDLTCYLLDNGADKNIKDKDKCTPLHCAASGRDYEALCTHVLLEMRADVNACNAADETPLHLAVQNGNEAVVGALVQSENCDVNNQDKCGNTPLHIAILQSKDAIFSEIIGSCETSAIHPTMCNKEGLNLIHLAFSKNNTQAVKELVSKYPLLLRTKNPDGWYPLHLAVLNNQYQNTESILDLDQCDIDLKNGEKKQTALFLAVSQGYRNIIELLVKKKADVNAEDAFGNTPLHVAVKKHCMSQDSLANKDLFKDPQNPNVKHLDYAIAIFLVLHGEADINYLNNEAKTPLDFCTDGELARRLKISSEMSTSNSRNSRVLESPDESNLKRAVQSNTGSVPNLTNMVCQTELSGGSTLRQAGTSPRRNTKLSVEAQGDSSPEHFEPTIFYRHSTSWPSLPTLPYDSFAPPPTIYSPPPSSSPLVPGNALSEEPALLPTDAFAPSGNASPQPRTSTPTIEDVLSSLLPPSLVCSLHPPLIPCIQSSSPQQHSASESSLSSPPPIPSKTAPKQSVAHNLPQRRSYPELPSSVDVNERPQNRYQDMSSPETQPLEKVLAEEKDPHDKDVFTMENMFAEAIAASASPLSVQSKTEEQTQCLCEDSIVEVIFEPCQHKVVCKECAIRMKRCPKCNMKIEYKKTTDGSLLSMTSTRPEDEEKEMEELKKKVEEGEIKTKCQICMEYDKNVVFDCGHTSCEGCSNNQEVCYFCQKQITQKNSLFL